MDSSISSALRGPIAFAIIRTLIVLPFFMAGLNKLGSFEGMTFYIANGSGLLTMPLPAILLVLAIAVELIAPILVVLKRWYGAIAAIVLAAFSIFTGIFYHQFAAADFSLPNGMDMVVAMKNYGWAMGLLAIAALMNRD